MSDKEKIAKLKEFVEETRAQIQGEKEFIAHEKDDISRVYRSSLDYAEGLIDQVSQILEGDV